MAENSRGINPEFRAGSSRSLAITATEMYSAHRSDRRNVVAGPDTGKTLLGVRPKPEQTAMEYPNRGEPSQSQKSRAGGKGCQCGPEEESISDEADRK